MNEYRQVSNSRVVLNLTQLEKLITMGVAKLRTYPQASKRTTWRILEGNAPLIQFATD